ncbi:GNAT family N-acetyltransferase [Ochrobactrum vermis]|uniref:GNAT family N-acetyltransferase n=1 Tax=Ochrobactrum vermis TaxID=1827297 RepID=A0ABU8PAH0_9HYPH|nr:GNAT family N-acetyltransferase [Ochrobactrum vermis]PQZ29572.1 GNAT family N-acetyltransferase [Ochrobactrum vermis]
MVDMRMGKEDQDARNGRYVARIEGIEGETEITFTKRGANLISADHTGAPDSMKGTGSAAALVTFMIEDARQNGMKIIPLCPYVRAQYRRHPEWADVMTVPPGEDPAV